MQTKGRSNYPGQDVIALVGDQSASGIASAPAIKHRIDKEAGSWAIGPDMTGLARHKMLDPPLARCEGHCAWAWLPLPESPLGQAKRQKFIR